MRKMTKLPIVAAALCLCALLAACGSGGNLVVIDRPSHVSTTPSPGETTETAVVTPTPTPTPTTETLTPTVVTPTPTTTPVEPTTTPVEPTPTVVTPTPTVTPGPHEHIYGAWQTTAEPTCTLPGAQVHTCTICGESVAEVIPALGHDYVDIAPAAPTCTEKGSTGGVRCARCGEIITPPNEIPATGHTIAKKSDLAPTCTQDGSTGGTYCAVCGVIVEQPTVVKATGHTLVYEEKRLPTATKAGHTAGAVCTVCKEVFEQVETLPAKGTDWMLEDGAFKILLIGNSFSQDTANFRFENEGNMLLSILKSMLGGDVKIVIGVCQSGSKTMAWHATQAQSGRYLYSFHIISSDDPVWRSGRAGDSSSQFALEYTNWDVVSLQPYHYEAVDGMDVEGEFASEIDERFYPMSVSIPYMLDHVQRYAPQADVYCIMPWNSTVDSVLNVGITKYEKSAAYFPQTLTYAGSESGKVFENIVPTALSVQNARSTYFGLFKYHTEDASKTQVFSYDSQFGLLRDGLHLSYNVGRYIASLTYAETVVPKEIRAKDYVLPSIRITESLGKLPDAYTELAQRCVAAALDSWSKGSLAVTKFTGDTVDPAVNAAAVLASVKLSVGLCKTEDALIKALSEAVLAVLPKDCVLESITLVDPFSSIGRKDFRVECVIRFGYTTQTVGAVGVME